MATLISYGNDIGFTILPYLIKGKTVQEELAAHPSDCVLGYVVYNKTSGKYKFTYTESGVLTDTDTHWSLAILNEFPYCEENGPWIVYNCHPAKARSEFGTILSKYAQSMHIYDWDIWSVKGKSAKVAVVSSWEIY